MLGLFSVSVPVTAVTGTASFKFISKLPVFILCVRCFLERETKEVILLYNYLSPESFPSLIWRREVVLPDHPLLTPLTLARFLPVLHPEITRYQPSTRHNSPPKRASVSHGKAAHGI